MPELQDIIHRLKRNQSIRAIQRETGTHRRDIRSIRALAEEKGWLETTTEIPNEFELQHALGTNRVPARQHPLDRFRDDFRRWLNEGMSFVVMHQLVREIYLCDESTIRRYVRKNFPEDARPVMRRTTVPGEIMEVDFGSLGLVYDLKAKRNRKAHLFSARLRHSRRAYRAIVFTQKEEVFFECHIHAFEYFGGVTEKIVMDNLKAAVIKACFNDPLVNRGYRSLAEHYGFMISPCLPYRPEHKGGVESDIKYVKNNFLPRFREKQRRLGREIPDVEEMREELEKWNEDTAELREIGGVGRTPIEIFESEEVMALRPLPRSRWDRPVWQKRKVSADWHLQFDKAFYSVPYRHIGETLLVCGTHRIVRIFGDSGEITSHERAARDWLRMTKVEHAPPDKEAYLNLNRPGLEIQAARLGSHVLEVVRNIFDDRAVDGLRPVRGLLRFAGLYSAARLDAACERALRYDTPTYRSVKNILQKNLDRMDPAQPATADGQLGFRFARAYGYFDVSHHQN